MQLWARQHELNRTDIHSALWKNRTLVKTSLMRQTLHLIPATEFSIYINALKTSRLEALWRIMSKVGITQKEVNALNELLVDALDAGPKTKPELIQQIMPKVGKKLRAYWGLVWSIQFFRAALVEGLICYGPEQNNKPTFIRVDHWLPKQRKISEQEAKQALLRRYLRAYGPATVHDFSKWTGMSTKEAKAVWESRQEELVEVSAEHKRAWLLREDDDELTNSSLDDQILRLLPHFDPYLLGHAEKDHLVDSIHYKRVYRNQGWISPVVLLNGRVIGVWSYRRGRKRSYLEIEPFEKFSKSIRRKVEEEAAGLGDFLETLWEIKFNQ
ncbi:MAG: winged helix DNA-binding domain-containing protein [candidate division KSB1 bacterium]|nr:winged helix DNA-binding domain-containing protein [candidate division KSB1 bacterium]